MDLFLEKGLFATRAEDVARRAGVSKGTLYLYYPSKDELFKAVVRSNLIDAISSSDELSAQFKGSTSELLRMLANTWWTKVGTSKTAGLLLLIMSEARSFPDVAQFYLDEVIAPTHAILARVIERGVQRGEFRSMHIASVVHGLIAQAQFLILYRQCTEVCSTNPAPLDPQSFMSTQIDLLLQGLERRDDSEQARPS